MPINAADNTFSGKNMVVMQGGALMPRGGLIPLMPIEPTQSPVWHIDVVRGLGNYADDHVWYLQEQSGAHTVVRRFKVRDTDTGYVTARSVTDYTMLDNITSLSTPFFATAQDGEDITYLAVAGDRIYRILHLNQTCNAVANSPSGANAIALFGDVLVLGGVDGIENRLRWSAPESFGNWPSVNFEDIGRHGESIRGLYVIGPTLYVLMKEGTLYAVSGTIGVNESISQVNVYGEHTAGIAYQGAGTVTRDNVLWHTRGSRNGTYFFGGSDHLTSFQVPVGIASGRRVEHPELDQWLFGSETDQQASPVYAMRLAGVDDVAFAYGRRMWAFVNGAWQKHEFPLLSPKQSLWASLYYGHVVVFDFLGDPSRFFLVNLEPETVDTVFGDEYGVDDRYGPGADDTFRAVDARFTTSEYEHPASRELNPRHLRVHFRRGPITGRDNTFTVKVHRFGTDTDEPVDTVEQTYREVQPADGEQFATWHASFNEKLCRRVSVEISGIDGVAIESLELFGPLQGALRHGPSGEA